MDGDVGRLPNAEWDMSLGGFNQDLPVPSMACEIKDVSTSQCAAISGVYNDQPFDVQAYGRVAYVYIDGGFRAAALGWTAGPDDTIEVTTRIGAHTAPVTPSTFEAPAPGVDPTDTWVGIRREARAFESHADDVPVATHDVEWRIAGELWFAQRAPEAPRLEQVLASFALSITPKPGCAPDADGFGCDTVRLRGTTIGATLHDLAAPP